MNAKRKALSRKPKVAPVMGSKVKMEKMLKRQMKSMSLSTKAATKSRKINMDESSSDDDSDASQGMEGVENSAARAAQLEALSVPKFS